MSIKDGHRLALEILIKSLSGNPSIYQAQYRAILKISTTQYVVIHLMRKTLNISENSNGFKNIFYHFLSLLIFKLFPFLNARDIFYLFFQSRTLFTKINVLKYQLKNHSILERKNSKYLLSLKKVKNSFFRKFMFLAT